MNSMTGQNIPALVLAAAARLLRWPCRLALLHDRKAATSLEFAMVALVFVFWLMSLITGGLTILAQATIDSATQVAGRQIQIGAIRGSSADAVRSIVCARLQGLAPLCSGIQVYATSGISFSSLAQATVTGTTLSSSSFAPGGSQSYVLLQIAYNSPFSAPISGISNLTLVSTLAFKNEP